jgi:hypothetical protein
MLSRVADNLYWMSRYLERAEHTARLIDVNLALDLERSPEARGQYWVRVLQSLQTAPPADGIDAYRVTRHLTFDQSNPASVVACISAARENARQVREQISSEMWEQINRFYLLCWPFCQILGGRRKGLSDPDRDAWPNTQDATKAPNQPAARVAPCVSDPRTIRPGPAGGARGVGHVVSRTAFYPC